MFALQKTRASYWCSPDICRPAYVIMIFADGLAPNSGQAIDSQHTDFNCDFLETRTLYVTCSCMSLINNQTNNFSREAEWSLARQFLCYWRVRFLITITPNAEALLVAVWGIDVASHRSGNEVHHHWSGSGTSAARHRDITWINLDLLSLSSWGTKIRDIFVKIYQLSVGESDIPIHTYIIVATDSLAPNRHQAISNHRADLTDYSVKRIHYNDVIMSAMESQITSLVIVYSSVYSGAHQSSASQSHQVLVKKNRVMV